MFILAIGRRKQVGKDEFAKAFREQFIAAMYAAVDLSEKSFILTHGTFEDAVCVTGFAAELKVDAYNMFAWAGLREAEYYETPEGMLARDIPLPGLPSQTPRSIWIAVGMFGRSIDPDYWVKKLFDKCKREGVKVLIVKDLRFQNEIDASRIESSDYRLIEVENPRIPIPTDVADTQSLDDGWQDSRFVNTESLEAWQDVAKGYACELNHWVTQTLQEMGYL